ncbi:Hypothetical_protein [Hexamita inflata]|uniref:Hypothetical_protein n=1 Tax=Hexamita inflata TaxID=28002 RepID=A0AA86RXJ3_9EUKA|nr:Hypothetical protein HINF_LOCUS62035 [Hexamita inflata]
MINKKTTAFLSNQISRVALSHVKPPHRISVSFFGLMEFVLEIFLLITADIEQIPYLCKPQQFTGSRIFTNSNECKLQKIISISINQKRLINTNPKLWLLESAKIYRYHILSSSKFMCWNLVKVTISQIQSHTPSCSVKHLIAPYSQIQELLNNSFLIWVFSGVFLTRVKSPSPCNPREYSGKDQCPLQNGLDSLHSRTNLGTTGYNRQARHAEPQLLAVQRPDRGGKFLRRRHVQLDRVKFCIVLLKILVRQN